MDKDVIMAHLQIKDYHAPLFKTLSGKLRSDEEILKKVSMHFGNQSKIPSVARFVRRQQYPLTDQSYINMAKEIFGQNSNAKFIEDLKANVEKPLEEEPCISKFDLNDDILMIIKNDFLSHAENILLNQQPIFTTPVFLDLNSPDMENYNKLILPWIQKTAGILLKNHPTEEILEIFILENTDEGFKKIPLEIIYPDFDVPPLKVLLKGELSTFNKMKILFWLMEFELSDIELPAIPEEYIVDCMILIYLVKKSSLTVLDARCILKTLVESRNMAIPNEYSTEYPKKINSRALRCTFLYSKMYFELHSCLSCFGMKNYCPELKVSFYCF